MLEGHARHLQVAASQKKNILTATVLSSIRRRFLVGALNDTAIQKRELVQVAAIDAAPRAVADGVAIQIQSDT